MSQRIMLFSKKNIPDDDIDHWTSVADLMAGLMMVFLFISVSSIRSAYLERDNVKIEKDKIEEIAIAYQENQEAIFKALTKEFDPDLRKWDAKINKNTLSFVFNSPNVLFAPGEIRIRTEFKEILNDFFPRYLNILSSFSKDINEVRIEGHTSSLWNDSTTNDIAYFNNMRLSQGRTRSVLQHIYLLESIRGSKEWIKQHIVAVGFSSSKKIIENNMENYERSRRVTFRVITNADTQIRQILINSDKRKFNEV